ncbi:MAG: hypothetical protein JWP10_45 [Nocardioidaceae bacterium]|nr:hypothetical protein [Nocardioidaceae bacterium]
MGAVAEELQLAAPTLRTWERRYGLGPARRSDGGHRRYTRADITRIQVMIELLAQGIVAQDAARMVMGLEGDALSRASDDVGALIRGLGPKLSHVRAVEAIVDATKRLDGQALRAVYAQALRHDDVITAWSGVFAPALRRIGQGWADGEIGIESEHLASELLHQALRGVSSVQRPHSKPSRLLLASAEEDMHALPVAVLQAALAHRGVHGDMLGPRLPAHSLVSAIERLEPTAVFLWASIARPENDPVWPHLKEMDTSSTIIVGGPGWPSDVLERGGNVSVRRTTDLRSTVEMIADLVA